MTHRERFAATLSHKQLDRPPIDFNGTTLTSAHPAFIKALADFCGIRGEEEADVLEKLMVHYDVDFRRVGMLFEPNFPLADFQHTHQGWYRDSWGVKRRNAGEYWDIVESPFQNATLEQIKAFPWPDASKLDRKALKIEQERARRLFEDSDYVVVAEHPVYGYFELGCWMFGFDDFLYRLLGEPETAEWFFQRYHQYVKEVCEIYYSALGPYIHVTTSGDDFGMQNGPFLSPQLFQSMVAPWYRERISLIKSICNIPYFHHSCGSVYRLLDGLLEMGVDLLNPIQPGAFEMEPERLKESYGDRLVFWGGIDEQHLLSEGKPEQIKKEVERIARILGKDGGFVMAASHNIQPDVPPENVDAMLRAGRDDH